MITAETGCLRVVTLRWWSDGESGWKHRFQICKLSNTSSTLLSSLLNFNTSTYAKSPPMNSLLELASRIEAAVESFIGIQQNTDRDEWQASFQREL
jgi:hypothetical protein